MKSKFAIAMMIYAALAIVALLILKGKIQLFVVIFLGMLAVKTWIARSAGW